MLGIQSLRDKHEVFLWNASYSLTQTEKRDGKGVGSGKPPTSTLALYLWISGSKI